MELADYRAEIDEIDRELLALFQRRMRVSGGIAAYKEKHNLPVLDRQREEEKIRSVSEAADEDMAVYCEELFRQLMAVSRAYQKDLLEQKR